MRLLPRTFLICSAPAEQIKRSASALLATLLVFCLVGVAGCNTVKGFGKDVSKAGEKIEKASRR